MYKGIVGGLIRDLVSSRGEVFYKLNTRVNSIIITLQIRNWFKIIIHSPGVLVFLFLANCIMPLPPTEGQEDVYKLNFLAGIIS